MKEDFTVKCEMIFLYVKGMIIYIILYIKGSGCGCFKVLIFYGLYILLNMNYIDVSISFLCKIM
jgi:hypothetical protein